MPSIYDPQPTVLSATDYAQLSGADQNIYARYLTLQTALSSPLDYAMYVSGDTEEYEHIVLLNELLVAVVEHRLYPQQYGACKHKTATAKNGKVLRSGHPEYGGPYEGNIPRPAAAGPSPEYYGVDRCHVPDGTMPVDKLFVTMPPRHGKSYLISEHFPAWFLSRYPQRNILLTSYEADFAASWGKKAKDHVQQHPEFGIKTDPESQAKANWKLDGEDRGGMNTAGAGGPITGKGGVVVIDDPIKNDEEANSADDREKKWNWLSATVKSRMEPGDVIIMVHTRWNDDDLGGRAMKHEPDKWYHIDMPALQPEEDVDYGLNGEVLRTPKNPLAREPGAALCPARYDREYLEDLRLSIGAYWFGALYQQRPTTDGKGIFNRGDFRYWRPQAGTFTEGGFVPDPLNSVYVLMTDDGEERYVSKKACKHFVTVDLAASKKTSADFTVFALWAMTPEHDLLLLDRTRERMESADHMQNLRNFYTKHRFHTNVLFIGVESATFGLTLLQNARRAGLPVKKLVADTDKVTRAIPAGALVSGHKVFFPRSISWLEEWESELTVFDKGAHDDQVDVLAYAAQEVFSGNLGREKKEDKVPTTMEERISAKLNAKKGKFRHPELGRLG